MSADARFMEKRRAAFDRMVALADGSARKLAALSAEALEMGPVDQAYPLARRARALAPDDGEVRSMTHRALAGGVPKWHFRIVRDDVRNAAYQAALERAVGPETRVLDIGAGTGLLAMMAARAGAGAVISCEMNPAVADAAAEIVALNGLADRVRVVAKRSTDLDVAADMGGRADLLVSEIVSNDLLRQGVLPVMEDAVARLLKPGGRMIPSFGQLRIALAHWGGLGDRWLGKVAGFDMRPFNRLAQSPQAVKNGDPALVLRSAAADLFDFDFASGGPFPARRTSLELVAQGGPVNGIVQWIRLRLDAEISYENRPSPGDASCWACLFHPLERDVDPAPGARIRVHGAHNRSGVRLWT